METTLHRELKQLYAGKDARFEAVVDGFRIDVVSRGRLVEIQHGPLAAIQQKVRRLLDNHRVLVVKPIVVRKRLVKRASRGGRVTDERMSPKCGRLLDLFDDLVHFVQVFPHPRLTLEVPLVDIEEWRYPGHGRRRRWRGDDHQIEDQRLVQVREVHRLRTARDLGRLVACTLPEPFHTGQLAESLAIHRRIAQRIAYCLLHAGVVREVGKQGNARLYEWVVGSG